MDNIFTITPPPSKSYSQRALAISLLVKNETIVNNIGDSEDELAALDIITSIHGIENVSQVNNNILTIHNSFNFNTDVEINCNESGTLARLFSILMCLNSGKTILKGIGSLLNRKLGNIDEIYNQIGAKFQWDNGKLPLIIKGNYNSNPIQVDASISSQYVTGLLYYYCGFDYEKEKTISLRNIVSKPYINISIEMLKSIGADINWQDEQTILIKPFSITENTSIDIENDWSGACYWIAMGILGIPVRIQNLNQNSIQADSAIIDLLQSQNANYEFINNDLIVHQSSFDNIVFDIKNCPDLAPTIAILCILSDGIHTITSVSRLTNKESNRLKAITELLDALKVPNTIKNDCLIITGNDYDKTPKVIPINTYNDHRIIMACSILDIFIEPNIDLSATMGVSKSYKNFFSELSRVKKMMK